MSRREYNGGAMKQGDLLLVQPVPPLDVQRFLAWPFPGLTALETAQSTLAQSPEYKEVIAATILSGPASRIPESMVQAAIPHDWKDVLGRFFHASLCQREAEQYGIHVKHVPHDGRGYHIEYSAMESKR